MADPNSWLGIAALAGLVIFVAASWLLHRRLRNRQSLRFLWSIAAFVAWLPISFVVTFLVLTYSNPDDPGQLANWLVISSEILIPSLLMLLVALTFWFAVRSIAPQPNNSFKPNLSAGAAKSA